MRSKCIAFAGLGAIGEQKLSLDSPPFCTCGEDARKVRLRQPGEPETRHLDSARGFARVPG
jgi:hypothetical protein